MKSPTDFLLQLYDDGCLHRFDCVYPTRTARFGVALVNLAEVPGGTMRLKAKEYSADRRPVDPKCGCSTCANYSRAFIHRALKDDSVLASQLLTTHNVAFMMRLMRTMREVSIFDISQYYVFVCLFMSTFLCLCSLFSKVRSHLKPSCWTSCAVTFRTAALLSGCTTRFVTPISISVLHLQWRLTIK